MSRAKPAAERVAGDAYNTPATLAEAVCATLARLVDDPTQIIEPSAGTGSFVRAARAVWPSAHVTAIDVDPQHRAALLDAGASVVLAGDWPQLATQIGNTERARVRGTRRLVVGNPPFREATGHVEAALHLLDPGEHLAFLLRLNLLGAASRLAFWKASPLWAVLPVIPRPSFVGGGTDATEYAVMVWRKGFKGAARILPPIVWRERNARRTA